MKNILKIIINIKKINYKINLKIKLIFRIKKNFSKNFKRANWFTLHTSQNIGKIFNDPENRIEHF